MPLLLLFLVALTAGVLVVGVTWRFPNVHVATAAPAATTPNVVEETVIRHRRLRAFVAARLDPEVATGLVLSIALVLAFAAGIVLAVLAYLVRGNPQLRELDHGVAKWGDVHASTLSNHGLDVVTRFGTWPLVAVLALVVIGIESVRVPSRWIVPFVAVVMGGDETLTLAIKHLADRARPTLNPLAATLGPSFPSGHSSTAAAFYAACALLLARRRSRIWRSVLAGAAVALAVAVAASRVLLDVHWLSDVIAGTMLGWSWFALASIAFGGRLLRFGAPAERVFNTAKGMSPTVGRPPS
jgi:membrane-associated phospholipid phosphatase